MKHYRTWSVTVIIVDDGITDVGRTGPRRYLEESQIRGIIDRARREAPAGIKMRIDALREVK